MTMSLLCLDVARICALLKFELYQPLTLSGIKSSYVIQAVSLYHTQNSQNLFLLDYTFEAKLQEKKQSNTEGKCSGFCLCLTWSLWCHTIIQSSGVVIYRIPDHPFPWCAFHKSVCTIN